MRLSLEFTSADSDSGYLFDTLLSLRELRKSVVNREPFNVIPFCNDFQESSGITIIQGTR